MSNPTITTAVVYHSGYGHTKRVAEAVAQGAAALLIAIDAEGDIPEDGWETLNGADAIIFGSPTYMGGPSWQFKNLPTPPQNPGLKINGRTRSSAVSPTAPASTATSSTHYNISFCWRVSTAAFGSVLLSSPRTLRPLSATIRTGWAPTSRLWRSRTQMRRQAKCPKAT